MGSAQRKLLQEAGHSITGDQATPLKSTDVLAIFQKYDVDRSGSLEGGEVRNFLSDIIKAGKLKISLAELSDIFYAKFDVDGDGVISFDEMFEHGHPPMPTASDAPTKPFSGASPHTTGIPLSGSPDDKYDLNQAVDLPFTKDDGSAAFTLQLVSIHITRKHVTLFGLVNSAGKRVDLIDESEHKWPNNDTFVENLLLTKAPLRRVSLWKVADASVNLPKTPQVKKGTIASMDLGYVDAEGVEHLVTDGDIDQSLTTSELVARFVVADGAEDPDYKTFIKWTANMPRVADGFKSGTVIKEEQDIIYTGTMESRLKLEAPLPFGNYAIETEYAPANSLNMIYFDVVGFYTPKEPVGLSFTDEDGSKFDFTIARVEFTYQKGIMGYCNDQRARFVLKDSDAPGSSSPKALFDELQREDSPLRSDREALPFTAKWPWKDMK